MYSVQCISQDSEHLKVVKQLWREHSDTLGYLPDGAFDDYARARHILVATKDNACAGYVLYRIGLAYVTIAHFCVAPEHRRQGVSRMMLNEVRKKTSESVGIKLNCRRDFAANQMWPHLGFRAFGNVPGRATDGSELVQWLLHYGKRDLFSHLDDTSAIQVAMDANITFHLIDGTDEETQGLAADWLRTQLQLCYTQELLNEIDRHQDTEAKRRRRGQVQQFAMLPFTPEAFQEAELILRPFFPSLTTDQNESDFRQLVCSLAGDADAFVTLDKALLSRAEEVFSACGLPVVRPAELIGRIDLIEREREYQRSFIGGTRQISVQRVHRIENKLVEAIKLPNERVRRIQTTISRYIAAPHRSELRKITDKNGSLLASYLVDRDAGVDMVPLFRVCPSRIAGTIARASLTTIIRNAIEAGSHSVCITDSPLDPMVQNACIDLGFMHSESGFVKLIVRGWNDIQNVAGVIHSEDRCADEVKALLPLAREDTDIASKLEHLLWPGKLADACIPSFVVPIQPMFAEHLFDSKLADAGLLGADVDLALNPESAYYRAAKPKVLSCPARILWYVSEHHLYAGAMAIRACSRITELAIGRPKVLYNRFRRLGVYTLPDILATAGGDETKEIMAFRFDDTEMIGRVPLSKLKSILNANGVGDNNMISPLAIPSQVFGGLYAASLDSTTFR